MKKTFTITLFLILLVFKQDAYPINIEHIATYFLIRKSYVRTVQGKVYKELVYKELWRGPKKWRMEGTTKFLTETIVYNEAILPHYSVNIGILNGDKMYEDFGEVKEVQPHKFTTFIKNLKYFNSNEVANPLIVKGKQMFDYSLEDLKKENLTQKIWYDSQLNLPNKIINEVDNNVVREYFIFYNEELNDLLFNPNIQRHEQVVVSSNMKVKKGANSLNKVFINKGDEIVSIDKENPFEWVKKKNRIVGTPRYTLFLEIKERLSKKKKIIVIYQEDLILDLQ